MFFWLVITCLLFAFSEARPGGAPSGACSTITPGHGGSSQTLPGGYYIYSDLVDAGGAYTANQGYTITLQGDESFKGFLIQARNAGTTTPIGSFTTLFSNTEHLSCSGVATASVTHSSNNLKSSVTFTWTAPATAGTVEFRYAVVKAYSTYYANINAADYRPPSSSSTSLMATTSTKVSTSASMSIKAASTVVGATMIPTTTTKPKTTNANAASSTSSTAPTSTPSASSCPNTNKTPSSTFPIIFRRPDGCEREQCTLYWAMGPNNENSKYVDIYMEGAVGGWMALGFSQNQLMRATDVLGCRVTSGTVEVIDSWNLDSSVTRSNAADDSQDGVCVHTTEYANGGRLKCLFSRSAAITDANQDFDLENPLYIIRGFRNESNIGNALGYHSKETPVVSSVKYSLLANPSSCPSTNKAPSSFFPITIGQPAGCIRDVNCSMYWAMGPNNEDSNYLDVYMEGDLGGWMAVGFSMNQVMQSTDVLGCRVNLDGTVSAVDGWNAESGRSNELDDSQDGVCTHMTNRENGRLSCLFSRYSVNFDANKDFNLDDSLYIIRGARNGSNTVNSLQYHDTFQTVSTKKYNPLRDSYSNTVVSSTDCPAAPADNAEYSVTFGRPGDDYYLGARLNDMNRNYLDFTLEGKADGWVAIGFTDSKSMYNSDVFACKRESSSDTVNVIDTWNPSASRSNTLDDTQSGMCQHTTEYSNGRIKCTFSHLIDATNDGQDFNLNTSLYQIYNAYSSSRGPSSSSLGKHSIRPSLSVQKYTIATDVLTGRVLMASDWPEKPLIKTHGILMIVSWILLAGTGIFFASWMKPILPNGEWFQIHRAIMLASLFTGAAGFAFAFIAKAEGTEIPGIINFDSKNISHFVFGWIIILFQIANPLIAAIRCAPTAPRRWIFNLVHGHLIGLAVEVLAFVNVGLGISLIETSQATYSGYRALWAYIVFVVGIMILQLIMFIVYAIKSRQAPPEHRAALCHSTLRSAVGRPAHTDSIKMSDLENEKEEEEKSEKMEKPKTPPRKKPLQDAPVLFSWVSTSVYIAAVAVTVLVLIVLIGIL